MQADDSFWGPLDKMPMLRQCRSMKLPSLPILRVSAAHLTQAGESPGVLLVAAAQVWTFWDTTHQEGYSKWQDRVTQKWLIQLADCI